MSTSTEDDSSEDRMNIQPSSGAGGVFSSRVTPRRAHTAGNKTANPKEMDVEVASISDGPELEERDFHSKQVFKGWTLALLAYQSLGVIYGDIGTSPLYVFSSTFSSEPSHEDVLGAVSFIIWALTIMVTIKYVCIVLYADDEGEGGTFAIYSLLSRYANLVRHDPRHTNLVKMQRHNTNELKKPNLITRNVMERSAFIKWTLKIIGAFGSILGAIQGITVVNPDISSPTVVGVSCAILVFVFLIQPFGTSRIATTFAPIVILWMVFNLSFGIYNLVHYDASVLKAFSPYFAGSFLVRNGRDGWLQLGGILLAFTGVETLFADLGAFSQRAIRISWLFFVYPCLLVSYIGQGAYISRVPSAYANPFYLSLPPGMIYPSLVVAILACIVASQAVITGSFQLLSQIMKLSYFPQIQTYHTSKTVHGQVYIPLANWLMMIGSVIVTAVYNNTTALGEAYGACVILVSFLTTCMVTVVALIVWRLPVYLVLPVFLIFALWDGMFLSAALSKVPHGAWFTLMLAAILTCIFVLWRYGKEEQWKAEESDNTPLSRTTVLRENKLLLQNGSENSTLTPINGLGIFFDKSGMSNNTPSVFLHFIQKFSAAPEVTVFLHLRPLSVPTIAPEERLIVRHGYTDEIVTPDLGVLVHDLVRSYLTSQNNSKSLESDKEKLDALDRAWNSQVIYIVGKEQLKVPAESNILRRLFLWAFLWMRDASRTKVQHLNVETDRVVEVGFVKKM
ncbi:potassium transporter [Penicillium concentricum]|uniref:Potassium transporter n=1 Tax=Penicillium concentricum TaxID=293559 RepID=A0A9W9V9Q8_9EURO|nr:potassium transporter [Penicillium concentricum]KAJ5374138.1 potassium transporter [Penicillium concentricum]